jgi:hypothetical protein
VWLFSFLAAICPGWIKLIGENLQVSICARWRSSGSPENDCETSSWESEAFEHPKKTLHAINSCARFLIKGRERQTQNLHLAMGCAGAQQGLPFAAVSGASPPYGRIREKETARDASNNGENASYLLRRGKKIGRESSEEFKEKSLLAPLLRWPLRRTTNGKALTKTATELVCPRLVCPR